MDTIEAINELCVSIDADMRAQRAIPALRLKYPLSLDWVQRLQRCPDWPEERVAQYAARRQRWVAADVAEDALDGHMTVGDAVWLLLQPGAILQLELTPFIISCGEHALAYASEATGCPLVVQEWPDWRQAELDYRRLAVRLRQLQPRNYMLVARIGRAARAAGLVAWLTRSEADVVTMPEAFSALAPDPRHMIARVAQIACLCCIRGPQPELLRQLKHLHALVT